MLSVSPGGAQVVSGAHTSGNWEHEIVSPDDLRKRGWERVGEIDVERSDPEYSAEPSWRLFRRNSEAGESFLIRNHKFQAPLLIWKGG